MKKFLINTFPSLLAAVTLLIVTAFLRYNLYISTAQLAREFQTQNAKELYSIDTLKISSRLNSFSSALNWVCIEAQARDKVFFSMKRGECSSGLFQQQAIISIPEADGIKVSFTLKLASELQKLFIVFLLLQLGLIISIIFATKKSENERRKKDIELYELSRRMFHDIRSPLASLNTVAEQLEVSHKQEFLLLKNSIQRINEIANSLLEKTQQKSEILKPEFLEIKNIITEIANEKKNEFKDKAVIKISAQLTSNGYIIPFELKRIFSNLLNNSIESTDSLAEILISTDQIGKNIFITIKDNGKGIPPHILAKLGQEEVTSKKKGNGIGFKHSLELLKEWQGDLKILETNDKGTIIQIVLLAENELTKDTTAAEQKIILVDDDELTRMTWSMKAKKSNIAFKAYASVDSFKADIQSVRKDDVLYIDSELGEIKGETLAAELHELGFQNISMASGHPAERFAEYKFLKSVISKKTPF